MVYYSALSNNPLMRTNVIHNYVYWDNAFTKDELDHLDYICNREPLEYGTTFGSSDIEEIKHVRNSKVKFYGRDDTTNWIFEKFNKVGEDLNEQFYNFNLNGYGSFQYTVYYGNEQGKYDWHMDMGMGGTPENQITREHRKLTMVLLMNEPGVDFTGGEFELNTGNQDCPLITDTRKGRIIAFPSYLIHRVRPVLSGIRKSIVIWIEGPKFV